MGRRNQGNISLITKHGRQNQGNSPCSLKTWFVLEIFLSKLMNNCVSKMMMDNNMLIGIIQ